VRTVIGLGAGLNIPVIAEGVETEAERLFLMKEGCGEMQGYYCGRPLPIKSYEDFTTGKILESRELWKDLRVRPRAFKLERLIS
jgi:EAL domain-containing protein (putative c-di-GMP-specific phosphodiesterase class I)